MTDVARVVQIVAAPQHQRHQLREVLQDPLALGPRRQAAFEPTRSLCHIRRRIAPG